jgi:uncharacterized membrane protein
MAQNSEYLPLPQPSEVTNREKDDAMGAYLMMFASLAAGLPLPLFNLIAATIYYFINKSESPFVQFHAFQSLTSQVPPTLLNAGAIGWVIYCLIYSYPILTPTFSGYLVMVGVVNLAYFIFSIVAAVKSQKGKMYYFIFFGKWAYIHAFKKPPTDPKGGEAVNKPPI